MYFILIYTTFKNKEEGENEWNNDGDQFSDALATEEGGGGGEGEINVDENRIKPKNEFYTNNPAINALISKLDLLVVNKYMRFIVRLPISLLAHIMTTTLLNLAIKL